ncbi:MAG TPA: glycosyltransferase family 39 protein [Nitrospirae bacterium]|nr:glycosyltransferase family 39 protein [Nitrospirota bacterium]
MKFKREYLILVCILLGGLFVRALRFGDVAVGMDVVAFSRLGKNLVESGRYVFGENFNFGVFFPPGYAASIGAINLFINDLFFSARLVSLISSIITIFLFYIIGEKLYNKEAGLFAAFAYAAYPLTIILSVYGNSDALFFCLLFLSIYLFMVSAERDDLSIHTLLGISIAAAYLTRPEGIFLLLLPFLRMTGFFGGRPVVNRRSLLNVVAMLSIFILIISPYLLLLKDYSGKFTLSGKNNVAVLLAQLSGDKGYHEIVNAPDNLYDKKAFSLNKEKTGLPLWDRNMQLSLFKDYILKDPLNFIKGYQKKIMEEIKILIKLLMPLMLPLLFAVFNRDLFLEKKRLIFILYPLLFFLMYPVFIIVERQILLIVVFLILFSSGGFANAGHAVSGILDYYGIRENRVTSLLGKNIKYIIVIILILSSLSYLEYSSFSDVPDPVEHERAGYFLKNNVSSEYEKLNVMSRKPVVSFFSDARFTILPYANSADVINYAKLQGVDYIVIDERLLSKWDFYNELIQMDKYSDDVTLAYEDRTGKLIRLFKVRK